MHPHLERLQQNGGTVNMHEVDRLQGTVLRALYRNILPMWMAIKSFIALRVYQGRLNNPYK